jgi:hypothetical protein
LLYAGTEFGIFFSVDNGKRWQSLQQNLPVTPVTDIRVYKKDLVLSTMGRSFWILDDVKPLQEIAQGIAVGGKPAAGLFTPREAYRTRYVASRNEPDAPEYPPAGARIDYFLANEPTGDLKLEIQDADGKPVRTFTSQAATPRLAAAPAESGSGDEEGRVFGRALPSRLPNSPGMHRFVWDLRTSVEGGRGGAPFVLPGTYRVKLSAGDWSETKTLEVLLDPRLPKDGVSLADLKELLELQTKLGVAAADARRAAARLRDARNKLKEDNANAASLKAVDALEARLVTAGGSYPQQMLIDQIANVSRMLGQADQKPGKDAWLRYEDVRRELDGVLAEVEKVTR